VSGGRLVRVREGEGIRQRIGGGCQGGSGGRGKGMEMCVGEEGGTGRQRVVDRGVRHYGGGESKEKKSARV